MSYDEDGVPDIAVSPTSTPKPIGPNSPKDAVSHEIPKPPIGAVMPVFWPEDREIDDSHELVVG